jgi:hypothetical protein
MMVTEQERQQRYLIMIQKLNQCIGELKMRSRKKDMIEANAVAPGDLCQLACDELAVALIVKELACNPQ